jgi:drug/metabolite transporter (DMT)-like permease
VIAILGGLGAALSWAITALTAARSSRLIGSSSTLAWVMLTGLVVIGPFALAEGRPAALHGHALGWLALAGAGNIVGLLFVYTGLRLGKVGVVSPISSAEGAVAALLAVAAGVVMAARPPDEHADDPGHDPRAALLGVAAALAFGVGLYATGRASLALPISWAILPPRLLGVLFVTIPLAALGRLRLTREAAPYVVVGGLAEVTGFVSYALGARHGIAVAAVLASQFAALAAIGGALFFHERLRKTNIAGVIVICAGVAVVSALQA